MDASVAIVGLGYVGLPLGLAFLDAGLNVVGYEEKPDRLEALRAGTSPIEDVPATRLADALRRGLVLRSPADGGLEEADAVFICVSTPITAGREPDLRAVLSAAGQICRSLRPGQLIILQSTTWPGTTAGPFRVALEASGLTAGTDFALAYAPERLNPGEKRPVSTPRLVGGLTPGDAERAAILLRRLGDEVVVLSSTEAAEMTKLLENVFRNVNIALVNDIALLCERMGLDVWEVVDAAATKPFGFMPFRPGPGVGGHCIPVDPYYLTWRARQFGLDNGFVESAGDINASMPLHVVDLVESALADRGGEIAGAQVGIIGVAFKPNIRDTRNSPAGRVMAELRARGALVGYHDPHVPTFVDESGATEQSRGLADLVGASDVVVALVDHDAVDWKAVYSSAPLVVDTVNSSRGFHVGPRRVLRLGAGWS
jgi:UDP-N-acetyl-D-glucosamine dehydrogenase